MGLINVIYPISSVLRDRLYLYFLITLSLLFALAVVAAMCLFQLRFGVKRRPKCLCSLTLLSLSVPRRRGRTIEG